MSALAIVPFVVLVVGAVPQGTPPQEPALDGTWLVMSLSLNGQVYSGDRAEVTITITGNAYEQSVNGQINERGTIKVDRTKAPMTIDFVITEGSDQNTTQLGIAEVTGDSIRLHLNKPGASVRPPDFNPRADHLLIIAKRK